MPSPGSRLDCLPLAVKPTTTMTTPPAGISDFADGNGNIHKEFVANEFENPSSEKDTCHRANECKGGNSSSVRYKDITAYGPNAAKRHRRQDFEYQLSPVPITWSNTIGPKHHHRGIAAEPTKRGASSAENYLNAIH